MEQWQVDEAFSYAKSFDKPILLSYFSHDHRDMRSETQRVIEMIEKSSQKFNIPFSYCDAKSALQGVAQITPEKIEVDCELNPGKVIFRFSSRPYQQNLFVFTLTNTGEFQYIPGDIKQEGENFTCKIDIKENTAMIAAAGHSQSGDKFVKVIEL